MRARCRLSMVCHRGGFGSSLAAGHLQPNAMADVWEAVVLDRGGGPPPDITCGLVRGDPVGRVSGTTDELCTLKL
mgnify:CR=1 FL=1